MYVAVYAEKNKASHKSWHVNNDHLQVIVLQKWFFPP